MTRFENTIEHLLKHGWVVVVENSFGAARLQHPTIIARVALRNRDLAHICNKVQGSLYVYRDKYAEITATGKYTVLEIMCPANGHDRHGYPKWHGPNRLALLKQLIQLEE